MSVQKLCSSLLILCLGVIGLTAASTAPADAASSTHRAVLNAEHMELRQNNKIVCKVYNTSRYSEPEATGCPRSGEFREHLWNSSDNGGPWVKVSTRTVIKESIVDDLVEDVVGDAVGKHTAEDNAQHMQLRNSKNKVVCSKYDTSRWSPPTATGCPRSGVFKEFLWNTAPDGSWTQVSIRKVKL